LDAQSVRLLAEYRRLMQTSVGVAPVNAPQLCALNAPQLGLPSLPGSSDESAGFNSDETPSSKHC
jgi:hypothetical protein